MKILIFFISSLSLFACSSGNNSSELFLVQHEQENLKYFYLQSQELYQQFEERTEDKSQSREFRLRMKKDFQEVQELDQYVWTAIEDLEEVKANIINEWTGETADKLMLNEFGGKGESIVIYDLTKGDNSTTDNYSSNLQNGKNLQEIMAAVRRNITESLAKTSGTEEKEYRFIDKGISDLRDTKDLIMKSEALVKASNVAPDDEQAILDIYVTLSVSESDWSKLLPEETSYLNLFHTICYLEKLILKSRQISFETMIYRYSFDSYNFDKILPIAIGKDIVSAGDTIELEITLAAFNSYAEPLVKCINGKVVKSSINNGKRKIKLVAPEKGEQKVTYKGTVTLKNKSGSAKTLNWEKEVWVKE